MRKIIIEPALNGWIVSVGCERILFVDEIFMIKELKRYLFSPRGVEDEYIKNRINKSYGTSDAEPDSDQIRSGSPSGAGYGDRSRRGTGGDR